MRVAAALPTNWVDYPRLMIRKPSGALYYVNAQVSDKEEAILNRRLRYRTMLVGGLHGPGSKALPRCCKLPISLGSTSELASHHLEGEAVKALSLAPRLRTGSSKRPPLPLVVATILSAIAIWVPICMRAGRLVWLW